MHLIFDGEAPHEEQAVRPLQKGKGRTATSLVQFHRTSDSNSSSKTKAVSGRLSSCGMCCLVPPP